MQLWKGNRLGTQRGQRRGWLILGSALLLAILANGGAPALTESRYYVDGARPSPHDEALPEDEYIEGCVSWSPERPGLLICGPVPDGYSPPLPPGFYPDVCSLAEVEYTAERALQEASLSPAQLGREYPPIDASTCHVIPTSRIPGEDPEAADYFVLFDSLEAGTDGITIYLNVDGGVTIAVSTH